jgi:hypothetical protein
LQKIELSGYIDLEIHYPFCGKKVWSKNELNLNEFTDALDPLCRHQVSHLPTGSRFLWSLYRLYSRSLLFKMSEKV